MWLTVQLCLVTMTFEKFVYKLQPIAQISQEWQRALEGRHLLRSSKGEDNAQVSYMSPLSGYLLFTSVLGDPPLGLSSFMH